MTNEPANPTTEQRPAPVPVRGSAPHTGTAGRWLLRLIKGTAVLALIASSIVFGPRLLARKLESRESQPRAADASEAMPTLAPDLPDALQLPADVVQRLGIDVARAVPSTEPERLTFSGTLTLDAEHYTSVRSRFGGEVVDMPNRPGGDLPASVGDRVSKGELLAIIWSRDLGEKKSELVDALSRQTLDTITLNRLQGLFQKGDIPERSLRDAERAVAADRISVDRAVRTLQAWRVEEAEIEAVRKQAENLQHGAPASNDELVEQWARVEIRAPFDGVLLERNVAEGEIVEPSDELYKLGNLSRLRVVAYAYEEDLPLLDALPQDQRHWLITVPADPALPPQTGTFDRIGQIVDPAQHTALVMGWVKDTAGQLRVGQFIKVVVTLPPPEGELQLPATALVERGSEKMVFVQPQADRPVYQLHYVDLSRRLGSSITIRAAAAAADGKTPLRVGDRIVTSGAVEMLAALRDLQAAAAPPHEPDWPKGTMETTRESTNQ